MANSDKNKSTLLQVPHQMKNAPPVMSVAVDDDEGDDCDDEFLLAALEQAENSNSCDAPPEANNVKSQATDLKPPAKRQFHFVSTTTGTTASSTNSFKTTSSVTTATTNNFNNNISNGTFKPPLVSSQAVNQPSSSTSLSMSEKAKIEEKRRAALAKLQQKRVGTGGGAFQARPVNQSCLSKPFASMTVQGPRTSQIHHPQPMAPPWPNNAKRF